jgi:hypothetical protein
MGSCTGRTLPKQLNARRDELVRLLTPVTGPLVHNPTRGQFLMPNAQRYGGFLKNGERFTNRFGVPAEIGLAQASLNPVSMAVPARAPERSASVNSSAATGRF